MSLVHYHGLFGTVSLVEGLEQCTARCPEHLQAAGHFDSYAYPGASGLAGFFLMYSKKYLLHVSIV